jgi:hypothetical protein
MNLNVKNVEINTSCDSVYSIKKTQQNVRSAEIMTLKEYSQDLPQDHKGVPVPVANLAEARAGKAVSLKLLQPVFKA